ncbi:phenylalanine--tRNA ligase subunit alpha [Mesoplasma corruscae]|uniref:Phenylalanine--tRNA ligase alpha subunit n=1 Tax=Mesoplasma corruscae TaxID=216874 RepID=A0A2S5RG22_9MOLU|nr:phenylalanine--tRNA ligase subunit alpha [Mesoplasma corruscae]PPE06260.1 phenylalanyl-tRNA synthetase subunit alpha [Mesoplasma corruscae]
MLNKIEAIKTLVIKELAVAKTVSEIEAIKKKNLSKDSELNAILKSLRSSEIENKTEVGMKGNELRNFINEQTTNKINELSKIENNIKLQNEKFDPSIPSSLIRLGTIHPLNIVVEELTDIFSEIGFDVLPNRDVEFDKFCFQNLNLPVGHPARDMQDSFYINEELVLSTHNTNMSARMLFKMAEEKNFEGSYANISIGNVYRRDDDDATHSHQFMQMDVLAVSKKINFTNLKWILKYMCKRLFGEDAKIRLRPSLFPFTEPSVEVDVSCFKCKGKGCSICKYSGWIEILGSGIINEQVMKLNGMDPSKNTALAFGVGIERIAMLKFGISNIRSLYENNIKFLEQFKFYGE